MRRDRLFRPLDLRAAAGRRHLHQDERLLRSVGCTKVEWPKKPIPPHDSVELRIAFTAEQEGAFFKKIAVRHSAAKHPVSFLIEGIVTNLPTN